MGFVRYNANSCKTLVGDCVVRAIATAEKADWADVYIDLCTQGLLLCDMPSSNVVWSTYLISKGYQEFNTANTWSCLTCYTVSDFCKDNPKGTYILATGTHVVAIIDGNYYDTWDCGNEHPIVCFCRQNDNTNKGQGER